MDVEELVRPAVEAVGLELVDVEFHRGGGRGVLKIYVDREGGVDLEAVSQASERISRRLDLEGFRPGPYTLEVSSPGVERPLRQPRDYVRRVGQKVKVKTASGDDRTGGEVLIGTIARAGADDVTIATEAGPRTVAYPDIAEARTVFEWGGKKK
jgi:ribosome maturation factor RimP